MLLSGETAPRVTHPVENNTAPGNGCHLEMLWVVPGQDCVGAWQRWRDGERWSGQEGEVPHPRAEARREAGLHYWLDMRWWQMSCDGAKSHPWGRLRKLSKNPHF